MIPLSWVLVAGLAAPTVHEALAAEAAAAETQNRWARARTACRAAIDADPTGPRALWCRRRLDFMDAREDPGGGFAAFTRLEALRREAIHGDPAAVRAGLLDLLGAEGVSPTVRAGAVLWLADDALDRLDDPGLALSLTGAAYADRAVLPRSEHGRLVQLHARALAEAGRLDEARAVEDEIRVASGAPRPTVVEGIAREQGRAREARVAWGALGVFAVLAAPSAARGVRGLPRPDGLVLLAGTLLATWAIAEAWAEGAGAALPWMAPGLALVHLTSLAARAGLAPERRVLRVLVSVAAVPATLAVGYLALLHTDTLPWIGW